MSAFRAWGLLSALLLLCAILSVAWYSGLRASPSPLSVQLVQGEVLRTRAGGSQQARVGMVLTEGDQLQTGVASEAVIARNGHSPIRITERSSVRVERIDDAIVEIILERGRIRARVRPDEGALRIANGRRTVLATDAAFEVSALEGDRFGVRADEGTVAVSGVMGVGTLTAGQQLVSVGHGRVEPVQISAEPLLDVAWPSVHTHDVVLLKGRVDPGAQVDVQWGTATASTQANASGAFEVEISPVDKSSIVDVKVTDVFGRVRHEQQTSKREKDAASEPSSPTFQLHLDYPQ